MSPRYRTQTHVRLRAPYERSVSLEQFQWTPHVASWSDFSRIYDESHGRGPHRGGDKGGPLNLHKKEVVRWSFPMCQSNRYRGPLFPNFQIGWNWDPDLVATPPNVLDARGTTAIARVAPENPAFNLSGFLAELTQGLPKIVGSTLAEVTGAFKKLGDEYLNVVFGWLPFVDDVQEYSRKVGSSSEVIRRYVTNSGEHIRRRYVYPPIVTTRKAVANGFAGDPLCNIGTISESSETITDEYWFSGAFRYYVPVDSRLQKAFDEHQNSALAVTRFDLTPEVLWNLAPWSWAVDWFTNVGDVMKNISAIGSDGLVMQYGYIMRKRTVERHVQQRLLFAEGNLPAGTQCLFTSREVMMERRAATPYGFGLDENVFSLKRLAILSALGLSKGTR